jgi:two-component system response regulator YesN
MKKVWFQRMIWSYIPMFMIIVCFLFFVFFQTLTEQNKKDSAMANKVFTQQVLYFIDATLQSIDHLMINELLNNELFKQFFEETDASDVLLNYKIADKIKNLKQMNPLIDSIYLVRYEDRFIFNGNNLNGRESFPDTPFIQQMRTEVYPTNWSSLRQFREFTLKDSTSVVSLIRRSPSNVDKGVLVVNVSTLALQKKVAEMYNPTFRFVSLFDRNGGLLFGDSHHIDPQMSVDNEMVTSVSSAYTGWEIRSGLVQGTLIRIASTVSSFWIVLGIIAFTLGIVSIFYITRKNYKPINDLLARIHAYSHPMKPVTTGNKVDEFSLIGATLGSLMEQSKSIARQYEDEMRVRKKFFFHELIGGTHKIKLNEWSSQMRSFGMADGFQRQMVIAAEIDRSANFHQAYSEEDQYLIKFVIISAFQEVMESQAIPFWIEWISDHQLAAIITLSKSEDEEGGSLYIACEQVQQWLKMNLKYTVTLAMGTAIEQPDHIAASFKVALKALQYKAVLGHNRIIKPTDLHSDSQGDQFKYVQMLQKMVETFGVHEEKWFHSLDDLFDEMRKDLLSREFIMIVLNDLISSINKEIHKMPKESSHCWNEEDLSLIHQTIDTFETLEDIQQQFTDVLRRLFQRLQAFQAHKTNRDRDLLKEIKDYIESNFMNPELSLEHLGQEFQMNAKYVSHLFREEFGEKFIDFLTEIRLRQAQKWLAETNWPIQDISEKVGYVNSISFRRVFKKHLGVCPGDYRKVKYGVH